MSAVMSLTSGMGSVAVDRGRMSPALSGGMAFGLFRLPTDSIGIFTLRYRNLVAGSRVRAESAADGVKLDEFIAAGAPAEDRTLPLYASGSSLNDLRIKVRNASDSPAYKPFETQASAQSGVVTIYVFQELDE